MKPYNWILAGPPNREVRGNLQDKLAALRYKLAKLYESAGLKGFKTDFDFLLRLLELGRRKELEENLASRIRDKDPTFPDIPKWVDRMMKAIEKRDEDKFDELAYRVSRKARQRIMGWK